jgi:hypothetical protein
MYICTGDKIIQLHVPEKIFIHNNRTRSVPVDHSRQVLDATAQAGLIQ